jgi:hypothetical protein
MGPGVKWEAYAAVAVLISPFIFAPTQRPDVKLIVFLVLEVTGQIIPDSKALKVIQS